MERILNLFKKSLNYIGKLSPFLCLLIVVYCLLQTHSLNKRLDLLDERVSIVENCTTKQYAEIQKTLTAINSHLEVLDKYASADWQHFYGIQNNVNIDSKTKRK